MMNLKKLGSFVRVSATAVNNIALVNRAKTGAPQYYYYCKKYEVYLSKKQRDLHQCLSKTACSWKLGEDGKPHLDYQLEQCPKLRKETHRRPSKPFL